MYKTLAFLFPHLISPMPKVPSKKGMFSATPFLGAIIFLIVAGIAVVIVGENEARLEIARSTYANGRLQFIAQSIMADSYNVLLQRSLEEGTIDFMKKEYNINTQEGWEDGLRQSLASHYAKTMGDDLGVDLEAYGIAYKNIPNVKDCTVESVAEGFALPSVEASWSEEPTLVAQTVSFGQKITCVGREPPRSVSVDIVGRRYNIDIRLPKLYEVATKLIEKAKAAINGQGESLGITEPVAEFKSSKWVLVKTTDNLPSDPSYGGLENIVTNWKGVASGFASRFKTYARDFIANDMNEEAITLSEFLVVGEDGKELILENFEVACKGGDIDMRNCIPFRIDAVIGNGGCPWGEAPENKNNPVHSVKSFNPRCDDKSCASAATEALKKMVAPLGNLCINYYASADSVYAACKAWIAKPRSIELKGTLSDTEYTVGDNEITEFKFTDEHSNVRTQTLSETRLTCREGTEGSEVYKDNVGRVLEKVVIKIGAAKGKLSERVRWEDKGSVVSQISNAQLVQIYEETYGKDTKPIVCFDDNSGVESDPTCESADYLNKPRIELSVDWSAARTECNVRANDLCSALGGGSVKSSASAQSFCKSLFPEISAGEKLVSGGKGVLQCSLGEHTIAIDFLQMSL